MIPANTRVWRATGHMDMRKGFDGLALLVQETLRRDPPSKPLGRPVSRSNSPLTKAGEADRLQATCVKGPGCRSLREARSQTRADRVTQSH